MRPAGNLAGVEFIAPPWQNKYWDTWIDVISESGYWFTKGAFSYFATRISWDSLTKAGPDTYLFISSEQDVNNYGSAAWDGQRRYSVRTWNKAAGVDTIGEFGQHATLSAAKAAIKQQLTNN